MTYFNSMPALAGALALALTPLTPAVFVINEVDSDQSGFDAAEFVELKGDPNEGASGLVLVFFNGSSVTSYFAVDLTGTADATGHYVVGNPGVNEVQETFDPGGQGFLQNGEDAVALYSGAASSFPDGTAPTDVGLLDFVVYVTADTPQADWGGFNSPVTVFDEDATDTKDTSSLSRIPDGAGGSFQVATPTPGAPNSAPTGPEVGLNVTEIDFGRFSADNTASPAVRAIQIQNVGGGTLEVSTFGLQAGSDAQFALDPATSPNPDPALPATLAAGEDVLLLVQFANSDTASDQTFTGAVEYVTDAPASPSGTVPLTAEFVTVQQTANAGDVVINEISHDPNPGTPNPIQDYNGDGTGNASQDEFLELFNTTGAPINVQGWELTATSGSPAIVDTEVIGAGVTLPAGGFLVFFRGGTPTGFAPGVAHVGLPALGNGGEILTLSDGTAQIDDLAYEGEEGQGAFDAGVTSDGGSIGLFPDGQTPYVEFPWDSVEFGPTPGSSNGTVTGVGSFSLYR